MSDSELPQPWVVERAPAIPRWRVRHKLSAGQVSSDDDLHVHARTLRGGLRVVLSQGANVVTINATDGMIEQLCQTLRAAEAWTDTR